MTRASDLGGAAHWGDGDGSVWHVAAPQDRHQAIRRNGADLAAHAATSTGGQTADGGRQARTYTAHPGSQALRPRAGERSRGG